MLDGLTGVPLASQEDGVRASGCTESQLVEGDSLATSLQDPVLGRLCELEGGDGELGKLNKTDVIGDGGDGDDDLILAVGGSAGLGDNFREGNGGTVDLGLEKSLQDNLEDGMSTKN